MRIVFINLHGVHPVSFSKRNAINVSSLPIKPQHALLLKEIRYSQLVEEQDHKFCTASSRKDLLAQKLDRLRALKDEIAKDEWMFEVTK